MGAKGSPLWILARVLQVVGMGVTLVGLFLSIDVGFREGESLHSMAVEFRYLGVGGALFLVGMLLQRIATR